jgi:uncharacterized protein (TIGR02646 family)
VEGAAADDAAIVMIRVRRPRIPASLRGSTSPGVTERAAAIAHFSKRRRKKFSFNAYKGSDVVELLEKTFYKKCAYCESSYRALMPVDVEHYRPKGAVYVAGKIETPGYYWLAADWHNLLPSCIDCNRERRQRRIHKSTGEVIVKSGKANHFPLANKVPPRRTVGCEAKERPLLLNPCKDDPEQFLEFGNDGIVRPRSGSTRKKARAEASINVLGLQRTGLVEEREACAKMVLASVQRVRILQKDARRRGASPSLRQLLRDELAQLRRDADSSRPYAGMVRQILERELGLGW